MREVNIIFPNQLFENSPLLDNGLPCLLVEEYLFFNQYKFHKQKIVYHRATMRGYLNYLHEKNIQASYIDAQDAKSDIRILLSELLKEGIRKIHLISCSDYWLEKRIEKAGIEFITYDSPNFLNTANELAGFFDSGKKKFFHHKFYVNQRKKWNILLDSQGDPIGGKWSFDQENRKKYPGKKVPPQISGPESTDLYLEAVAYTNYYFDENPGNLTENPLYPIDFLQSKQWLRTFLNVRFLEFGTYEDAILKDEHFLHHSVLTPMLNIGLLTPNQIVNATLAHLKTSEIPINSAEGFIRQIIGWREFIHGLYHFCGVQQRTTNYWGFKRKIPLSFYNGTTGILPIDTTIKKVLETGYCHHIERLMVLGNFMLLCEFDPDAVYQWFMELFIDAYDWVMVPNVYGMSQFADGGMMATKPYISGSNYLMKMSNYPKGDWQQIWDGLFWRFMDVHRDFFLQNPRLGMLIRMFDKMPEEKKQTHHSFANQFLESLD